MSYQLLQDDYTDTPGYGSNPTVQPGNLLQSGGGVAYHVHGGSGPMYSRNSERSDIFGYSTPRQDKFYGQMYGKGPSYMENFDLWTPDRHEATFKYPYAWDHHSKKKDPSTSVMGIGHDVYGRGQSKSRIEKFRFTNDIPRDDKSTTPIEQAFDLIPVDPSQEAERIVKVSPYLTLLLFILLFIAIDYWIRASNSIIKRYVFKGNKMKSWHLLALAVIVTALFITIAYFSNISLRFFEIL